MVMRTVTISEFKAKCLALLDDVATSGDELVVTKRGRPIVRVIALTEPPSLEGSVRFLVDDDELIAPVGADWDAS